MTHSTCVTATSILLKTYVRRRKFSDYILWTQVCSESVNFGWLRENDFVPLNEWWIRKSDVFCCWSLRLNYDQSNSLWSTSKKHRPKAYSWAHFFNLNCVPSKYKACFFSYTMPVVDRDYTIPLMDAKDLTNTMSNDHRDTSLDEKQPLPGYALSRRRQQQRRKARSIVRREWQLNAYEQNTAFCMNDSNLERDCYLDFHLEDDLRDSVHLTKERMAALQRFLPCDDDEVELKKSRHVRGDAISPVVKPGHVDVNHCALRANFESLDMTTVQERTLRANAA